MVAKHTLRRSSEHLEMEVVIRVKLPLNASMLEQEDAIQSAINQAGLISTRLLLEHYDTGGHSLVVSDEQGREMRLTAKGKPVIKEIETPYGSVSVPRHVYQSSAGGACLVPLDRAAGLIGAATPKFAQMVASKVAEMPARSVVRDLADNHQRSVSLEQLQHVSGRVGELARAQQEQLPMEESGLPSARQVKTITLGVDAASMLMNTAGTLLAEMRTRSEQSESRLSLAAREGLGKAMGYIGSRVERMDYARLRQDGIPIGSGVTESACKLIIKHRMCGPGMRWGHRAADHVLALRCLLHSDGMWRVLWSKLSPKNKGLALL